MVAFSFDKFMKGLASGSDTGLGSFAKPYVQVKTQDALNKGIGQIQEGDWQGGISTIGEWSPETANNLALYKQKADDTMALEQMKIAAAEKARNSLTPYQQEMLSIAREKLAQKQSGESNPFSSKNEFINLMGIRNNPEVWDSLPDDQKALVNARLNYMSNNPDNAYDISYQRKRGSAQADIETRGDIAYQGQLGKDRATFEKENTALERNLPAFEDMTNELIDLADKATYTVAGQARDSILRQLKLPMSDGGIAREKYKQVVANELIPKLKQMFGGQLSDSERQSLLATLGDVNLSPEEKKAAISAFIEAKRRQVKYNNTQQTPAFGQSQTPINQDMESETKDANYYKNKYGF